MRVLMAITMLPLVIALSACQADDPTQTPAVHDRTVLVYHSGSDRLDVDPAHKVPQVEDIAERWLDDMIEWAVDTVVDTIIDDPAVRDVIDEFPARDHGAIEDDMRRNLPGYLRDVRWTSWRVDGAEHVDGSTYIAMVVADVFAQFALIGHAAVFLDAAIPILLTVDMDKEQVTAWQADISNTDLFMEQPPRPRY